VPPAGAIYLIDPTLRQEYRTLAFRASVAPNALGRQAATTILVK
jgi:hypothetical protein